MKSFFLKLYSFTIRSQARRKKPSLFLVYIETFCLYMTHPSIRKNMTLEKEQKEKSFNLTLVS